MVGCPKAHDPNDAVAFDVCNLLRNATVHCVKDMKDESLFTTIDPSKRVQLKVADGRVVTSDAIDTAPVKLINSTTGKLEEIILHHVMYHPHG